MKHLIFIVLVIFSLNSLAQSGTKNFIDENFIEVTGKAEMELTPDEIYLKIIVDEKDFKGKKKISEVEKSIVKSLTKIGIDVSKDFAVKDMASNFKKYWLRSASINTLKEYQLKLGDAKTAGLVFRELEALGVSNISIEKIEHSEIEKYRTEVKINAIKAARKKAEALTGAIDQKIGKAIYIQEVNTNFYRMQSKAAGVSNIRIRGYSAEAKQISEPEIEFEKIKLEYSILTRFSLE